MASTLKSRIEQFTGTESDTDVLSSAVVDGYRDVVERVRQIDISMLYGFAQTDITTVNGSGFDIIGKSVLEVLDVARGTYPSIQVDPYFRSFLTSGFKMATARHPKHYTLNGKIYIKPDPAASPAYGAFSIVTVPTITVTGDTIPNCPLKFKELIVKYAAIQVLLKKINDNTFPSDLSLPIVPDSPTLSTVNSSLPTFSAPAGFVPPSTPPSVGIDFSSVDLEEPSFSSPAGIILPTLDLSGITLSIDAIDLSSIAVPVPPESPSFSTGSITLPTTFPTYTPPVLSVDFSTIDTVSLTDLDPEAAIAANQTAIAKIQKFQTDIANSLNVFNEENVEFQGRMNKSLSDASNQLQSEGSEYIAKIQRFSTEVQKYQIAVNAKVADWQRRVAEKAIVEFTTKRNNALQQHQLDSQNAIAKFTSDLNLNTQVYTADFGEWIKKVDRLIQTAQVDSATYRSLFEKEAQRHLADLNTAVQETNNLVQKYSLETQNVAAYNSALIQKFSSQIQSTSVDMSAKINDYNSKVAKVNVKNTWYLQQLNTLWYQYNSGFVPFQKQKSGE